MVVMVVHGAHFTIGGDQTHKSTSACSGNNWNYYNIYYGINFGNNYSICLYVGNRDDFKFFTIVMSLSQCGTL